MILELNSERTDAVELAKQRRTDKQLRAIPLHGFFSHVQTQSQRQTEEAGFDRVLQRSAFTKVLPERSCNDAAAR